MRKVQWRSIKFYSLLILALTTLMFEPSCNEDDPAGRPSAKFIFKGTVLSANDSLPINGIHVKMLIDTTGMDSTPLANTSIYKDSAITDQNGNFEVIDPLGIPAEVTYIFNFNNAEKGLKSYNEPIDSTMKYQFKNLSFTNGDGHWYAGETIKLDTFRLEIKK